MANFADIIWSPNHEDRFAVICKSVIYLFKINDVDDPTIENRNRVKIIGDTYKFKITLLNAYKDVGNCKSFAWKPCLDSKQEGSVSPLNLFAIGLSSGNVKLISLQNVDSRQDQFGLNNKELVTRANRICGFLYWNPWRTTYLAQGLVLGRYNRETSVLVWDVVRETSTRSPPNIHSNHDFASIYPSDSLFNMEKLPNSGSTKPKTVKLICDRPLCDACQNEHARSFTWVSKNSFVVGLMNNYLKLYDISDTAKAIQMTQTRLVYGLTSDPLCTARVASFEGKQVGIWNWENFEKPMYVFTERKEILSIRWSPLREGWLGVLLVDSLDVRIYNTQIPYNRSPAMEESEQFLFEMRATLFSDKANVPLAAFAWHGSIVNCILTIDKTGCLNVAKVHQLTAVNWSPNQTLLWTCGPAWLGLNTTGLFGSFGYVFRRPCDGEDLKLSPRFASMEAANKIPKQTLKRFAHLSEILDNNLSSIIQKRADAGYGLGVESTPYSEIVANDPHLRNAWVLIEYLQQYIDDWSPSGKTVDEHPTYGSLRRPYGNPTSSLSSTSLRCQGALGILCGDRTTASEVLENPEWHGVDAALSLPRYSSPERSRVLRMCMWPLDAASDVQRSVFESVCAGAEFERAAAMALVNLHFDWALSFLSRSAEYRRAKQQQQMDSSSKESPRSEDLLDSGSVVSTATTSTTTTNAMAGTPATMTIASSVPATGQVAQKADLVGLALSGFSDPNNVLWRATCADVLRRLNNPYLRVMFKFLSCCHSPTPGRSIKGFMDIVENEGIILIDRLACACLYLNDQELSVFVRSTCDKMIAEGRLEAILLTGFSTPQFFNLLQAYLDRTGDVQSAAILGLHACKLCKNPLHPTLTTSTTKEAGPAAQAGVTAAISTATPRRAPGQQAGRFRFRPGRESMAGAGFGLAAQTPPPPPPVQITPGDQIAAKMGGRRLANWVESYRDLLDRWRMWFYRVDFDNHYCTRLTGPFLHDGSGHGTSRPAMAEVATPAAAPAAPLSLEASGSPKIGGGTDHLTVSMTSSPGVRGIGLPAAANQIFMACTYCGRRLGGVVRGITGRSQSMGSHSIQPAGGAFNPSGAEATATTPIMHGGGGKQTICGKCLKPLPRCAICLMHMGSEMSVDEEVDGGEEEAEGKAETGDLMLMMESPSCESKETAVAPADEKNTKVKTSERVDTCKSTLSGKLTQKPPQDPIKAVDHTGVGDASRGGQLRLASWFVWCQACRHGGHAGHIFNWFHGKTAPAPANLIECPVNGCLCRCASLDFTVPPARPQVSPTPQSQPPHTPPAISKTPTVTTSVGREDYTTGDSDDDTEKLSSEGEDADDNKVHLAPASVPKNRREIVDPFVGIMMAEGAQE